MQIDVTAYAKLNLSLDIVRKRADGYHDLKMIMQTVQLCDNIVLTLSEGSGVSVQTNLDFLPKDGRNLAGAAALLFFEELGLPQKRVKIEIHKNIPVCAGLAGGSADAAAVLRGLNTLLETNLSSVQLAKMGTKLGADVPYCIIGGTALAEGRGEILTPLPPLPPCHIVIAKPGFAVSTSATFAKVNCKKIRHRPNTAGLQKALEKGQLQEVAVRLYNVFEDIVNRAASDIVPVKAALIEHGALGAAMTGTGPAVFGLFSSESAAQKAYAYLAAQHCDVFLTKSWGQIMV